TKPSRRSTNSSRSTSLGPLLAVGLPGFLRAHAAVESSSRQRNLGPAGPRQSMQTDDPVSRCGPGKGTQSSISLPEVKILYLKDLSLDDGEDGDNQLERPDHPPEGAPRQVSSPRGRDGRGPRCRGRNPDQTWAREPSRTPEGQDRLEGIRGGGPETPQGVDPLTDFLLDTIALVRHLEDSLPDGADRVFREAEGGRSRLFLPEIALGEFLYVALRGRLRASNIRSVVDEVLDQIRASGYLVLSAMSAHRSDRHTKPLHVDWRTQESGIQGSLLLGQLSISSARTPSASRTERWDLMTEPIGSRSCAPLSAPSPICPAPEPLMDRFCRPVAGPPGACLPERTQRGLVNPLPTAPPLSYRQASTSQRANALWFPDEM